MLRGFNLGEPLAEVAAQLAHSAIQIIIFDHHIKIALDTGPPSSFRNPAQGGTNRPPDRVQMETKKKNKKNKTTGVEVEVRGVESERFYCRKSWNVTLCASYLRSSLVFMT